MARQSKLTPEQWAIAKRRWEGCDKPGFEWLRVEVLAAFGDAPSRPGIRQVAAEHGWEKGGDPSEPLQPGSGSTPPVKTAKKAKVSVSAAPKVSVKPPAKVSLPEVAGEVVDGAAPGSSIATKPPGYAGTGRPAKYKPEFDALIVSFFDKEPFTEHQVDQGDGFMKLQRMPTDPPMLATFAKSIGVSMDAVNSWATAVTGDGAPRYPGFAEAYARAREMNEALLVRAGLLGLYDNKVLQFALKNLYGWQDQPNKSAQVQPISRELLDKVYGENMAMAHERMAKVLEERRRFLADL